MYTQLCFVFVMFTLLNFYGDEALLANRFHSCGEIDYGDL